MRQIKNLIINGVNTKDANQVQNIMSMDAIAKVTNITIE